nr:hypothetical protein [Tanacetum cinerariifolium]
MSGRADYRGRTGPMTMDTKKENMTGHAERHGRTERHGKRQILKEPRSSVTEFISALQLLEGGYLGGVYLADIIVEGSLLPLNHLQ